MDLSKIITGVAERSLAWKMRESKDGKWVHIQCSDMFIVEEGKLRGINNTFNYKKNEGNGWVRVRNAFLSPSIT